MDRDGNVRIRLDMRGSEQLLLSVPMKVGFCYGGREGTLLSLSFMFSIVVLELHESVHLLLTFSLDEAP